jgi:alpha-glucosidase
MASRMLLLVIAATGFDLSGQGISGTHVKTLLKTPGASDFASLHSIRLGPFGVYIGPVE